MKMMLQYDVCDAIPEIVLLHNARENIMEIVIYITEIVP